MYGHKRIPPGWRSKLGALYDAHSGLQNDVDATADARLSSNQGLENDVESTSSAQQDQGIDNDIHINITQSDSETDVTKNKFLRPSLIIVVILAIIVGIIAFARN